MKLPRLFPRSAPRPEPVLRLAPTIGALPPRRDEQERSAPPSRRTGRRFYTAGSTEAWMGWDTYNVSADAALYLNLNLMKARARDLARNNDYVRHFLRLLESNVVGPSGFTLHVKMRQADGSLDRTFGKALEDHWRRSGKLRNSPSTCGRMTRREMAALWIRTLAVDGEVLEIDFPAYGNKYRFATRLVDPALIDWQKNGRLPNGNRVKMGVEIDSFERPVAYWILNRHPADFAWEGDPGPLHTRIPAERARLTFLLEQPGQTRGVSWLASPALRAQMLQKFEEAVVVTSRASASKGGFYKLTEDFEGQGPGEEGQDASGEEMLRRSIEPGEWEMLPRGVEAVPYDPQFPPANLMEMSKVMLRGVASGLGVDYVGMSNNLEGVNYSSIRAGALDQRGIWRALQRFTIDHHVEPIFEKWATILRLNPATPIDGRKLDACLERDAFRFIGRGWDWVDPLKEVNAHAAAIANRLTTRGRVIAERTGEDFEDVLEELAEEERMLAERGMTTPAPASAPAPPAEDPEEPTAD